MNPFVSDRFCPGEATWSAFHRPVLEHLEKAVRAAGDAGTGQGRVIQLRSCRAGMGKSHLVGRLADGLGAGFAVQHVEIRPENLRGWERSWDQGVQLAGSGLRSRLLVMDHLDAFHGNPAAGMRIARFVERFSNACRGGMILLVVNRDLWRSAFGAHLPAAFRDLLTWEVVDLPPALTADEAEGLVIHRMENAGMEDHVILQFLERLDLGQEFRQPDFRGLSPRQIFRRARKLWLSAGMEGAAEEVRRTTVPFSTSLTGTEGFLPVPRAEVWPAADEARKHLHAVAEALRGQAGPRPKLEFGAGRGTLRLLEWPVDVPAAPSQSPVDLPPPAIDPPLTLPELFQEVRLRFLDRQPLEYRPDLIFHVLRRVGERFPSIQQVVVNPDSPVEERVLDWTWFSRRIWIGVAPLAAADVWERVKQAWKEGGLAGAASKLVGFGEPGTVPAPEGEIDLIELRPDLLASLYAAEEVLRLSASLGPGISELRVTGFIAGELDFFWARLTRLPGARPPGRAVEQAAAT